MDIISFLYGLTGILIGISYIPQIVTLLRDRTGAAAINLSMWIMLTACASITLLYALTRMPDPLFIATSAVAVTGNISIVSLVLLRRRQGPR